MRVIGMNGSDILPKKVKTQGVLAYLCLSEGRAVQRSRLAGMLWDNSPEALARDSLRQALTELEEIPAGWRISRSRHTVLFDPGNCWIDVFEAPDRPEQLLEGLQGISSTWDHWLITERVRLERLCQDKFERELNEIVVRRAPPESRAAAARKLLNLIPTHDSALRELMGAYVELDDRAMAIREYERFRTVLIQTLGVSPSRQTLELYDRVRQPPATRAKREEEDADGTSSNAKARLYSGPGLSEEGPSIAVLPFRSLTTERKHALVAEGLAEDLVEAISRVPGLLVVSRLSAANFRHTDRPPSEIGAALGVRYILSGTARIVDKRLRLVAELTEAATSRALSIERFDECVADLLAIQSNLAERIACSVAPHLRGAELRRLRIKRPDDRNAYELFLCAQESMHRTSRAAFESAEPLLRAALRREPSYAAALAWLAHWHVLRVGQGWSFDPSSDADQAEQLAEQAIGHDPTESLAVAVQGHIAAYLRKDFGRAFAYFETARRLNPNNPRVWLWNANAHAYVGEGAEAVESVKRAMELSPFDPLAYAYSCSGNLAYLADGQYERAVDLGLRCIAENQSYTSGYRMLIPALVLTGRDADARALAQQLLSLQPDLTVAQFKRRFPGMASPLGEVCSEALARAGIPSC
jgi:TolB-like protein/DNA-binding SARP family transcriptional activator/Flp pilus assembly protein TadD